MGWGAVAGAAVSVIGGMMSKKGAESAAEEAAEIKMEGQKEMLKLQQEWMTPEFKSFSDPFAYFQPSGIGGVQTPGLSPTSTYEGFLGYDAQGRPQYNVQQQAAQAAAPAAAGGGASGYGAFNARRSALQSQIDSKQAEYDRWQMRRRFMDDQGGGLPAPRHGLLGELSTLKEQLSGLDSAGPGAFATPAAPGGGGGGRDIFAGAQQTITHPSYQHYSGAPDTYEKGGLVYRKGTDPKAGGALGETMTVQYHLDRAASQAAAGQGGGLETPAASVGLSPAQDLLRRQSFALQQQSFGALSGGIEGFMGDELDLLRRLAAPEEAKSRESLFGQQYRMGQLESTPGLDRMGKFEESLGRVDLSRQLAAIDSARQERAYHQGQFLGGFNTAQIQQNMAYRPLEASQMLATATRGGGNLNLGGMTGAINAAAAVPGVGAAGTAGIAQGLAGLDWGGIAGAFGGGGGRPNYGTVPGSQQSQMLAQQDNWF